MRWHAVLLTVTALCIGCGERAAPVDKTVTKTTTNTDITTSPDDPDTPATKETPPEKLPPAKTFITPEDKDVAALKDAPAEELIAKLADEKERGVAVRALVARGGAAVEPLTGALASEDPQARAAAAFALSQLGQDAAGAVDALKKVAAEDEDEVARDAAVFALAALEGE